MHALVSNVLDRNYVCSRILFVFFSVQFNILVLVYVYKLPQTVLLSIEGHFRDLQKFWTTSWLYNWLEFVVWSECTEMHFELLKQLERLCFQRQHMNDNLSVYQFLYCAGTSFLQCSWLLLRATYGIVTTSYGLKCNLLKYYRLIYMHAYIQPLEDESGIT